MLPFLDLSPAPLVCPLPASAPSSCALLGRHPRIIARFAQVTTLTAPEWLPCTLPESEDEFLQQVIDLFDHIDRHCFPLDLGLVEMLQLAEELAEDEWYLLEECLTTIPVRPWGIDLCSGWISDLRDPLAFVTYLLMVDGPGDAEVREALAQWIDPSDVSPSLEVDTLLPALAQLPPALSPLDGLPDLLRYVLQDTGTLYLDGCPSCESYGSAEMHWSAGNVAWLREEWARTEPIWERIWALIQWAEHTPDGMAAIWRRLLQAHAWDQLSDEYGYSWKESS